MDLLSIHRNASYWLLGLPLERAGHRPAFGDATRSDLFRSSTKLTVDWVDAAGCPWDNPPDHAGP